MAKTASKNNPDKRGDGGRVRSHDGKPLRPVLYIGRGAGGGRYMAALDERGELVVDASGRPIPFRSL